MTSAVTTKEYCTLAQVRDRVRVLVEECPAFRKELENAIPKYLEYLVQREARVAECYRSKREAAKAMLVQGRLIEDDIMGECALYFVDNWEYPTALQPIEREWYRLRIETRQRVEAARNFRFPGNTRTGPRRLRRAVSQLKRELSSPSNSAAVLQVVMTIQCLPPPGLAWSHRFRAAAERQPIELVARLERILAACVLASLQKQDGEPYDRAAPQLIRQQWQEGLNTDTSPELSLRRRPEFREPPSIGAFNQPETATALVRLYHDSREDYRTIAFAALLALASTMTTRPIVAFPRELPSDASQQERVDKLCEYLAWRANLNSVMNRDLSHAPEAYEAEESIFPVHIARDFLQEAENFVQELKARQITAKNPRSKRQNETPEWTKVARQLLKLHAKPGFRYTTTRELAKQLDSTESTVRKAINNTPALKAWAKRSRATRHVAKVQRLNSVIEDSKSSTRETDPTINAEVNEELQRLIDEQKADDRQGRPRRK